MLKVYMPEEFVNPLRFNRLHSLMFDCDQGSVEYTTNCAEADLVCLLPSHGIAVATEQYEYLINNGYHGQFVAALSLFHISEHQSNWGTASGIPEYDPYLTLSNLIGEDKLLFVHHDVSKRNLTRLVYYDMMWARSKMYFTEYDKWIMYNRVWLYDATEKMFSLSPIKKTTTPKHFLSPMRTYEYLPKILHTSRITRRKKLRSILDSEKGYVSDHGRGIFLKPQEDSLCVMDRLTNPDYNYGGGTWYPVHNDYYNDSIVSIYVETITFGAQVATLTEKTFDPLIKGHFVLPYGYKGMINDIKSYGFLLPEWIDYSYDEYDDNTRWDKYVESVLSYLNIPIEEVIGLAAKDDHILQHNRSVFYTRPRQNLVELLENEISRRSA